MNGNEVIKALECCTKNTEDCYECPLQNKWSCDKVLGKNALDLINRQKAHIEKFEKVEHFATKTIEKQTAEIERKTTECERLEIYMDELVKQKLKQVKSEAYREFAERLKESELYMRIDFPNTECGTETYIVLSEDIDNLAKELTESK